MSNDPALYVEGVPVKISEKFRPPRKVKLTSSCYYQVNTTILTEEYDFICENKTLHWLEERRKSKENVLCQRKENIKNYEEDCKKKVEKELQQLKEEEEKRLEKQKEEEEEEELKRVEEAQQSNEEDNTSEDNPNELNEKESKMDTGIDDIETSENLDSNVKNEDPDISLQPFPSVLIPIQCSPKIILKNSSSNLNTNINFAEFEGDGSDPFDSVALKSINDMEELAKVLQSSTTIEKPPCQNQYSSNRNPNGIYPNGSIYPHYPNYPQCDIPSYTPYSKVPPHVPLSDGKAAQPFQPHNYNQHHSSWDTSVLPTPTNGQETNQFPFPSSRQMNSSVAVPLPAYNTSTPTEPIISSGGMAKRQDLEDFYSRYYLNQKVGPSTTNARSGQNTPTANMFGSLRSSTSVPDLTAAGDSEVSIIVANSHNNCLNTKPSVSNPPSRPSSTFGVEGLHSKTQGGVGMCLPDPFTELTEDAQALVQGMAEMGFPRPRVARAVQKLGTDHKKLLEVLLLLQSLKDSGEDEYRAERAFYFYMGDVPKVNEFLAAAKTLLDLGFSEETVIEHLFKHQNDKDKCLEELIS